MPNRRKKRKVVKYRRKIPFNLGIAIFVVILGYMLISTYKYVTNNNDIAVYEVVYGEVTTSTRSKGIILRNETVYKSKTSGVVNVYFQDSQKASIGTTICTVDKTGKVSETLENNTEETNISEENKSELRAAISNFNSTFNNNQFSDVYSFKFQLNNKVMTYNNKHIMKNLNEILQTEGVSSFDIMKAKKAGIVSFVIDGYENLNIDNITEDSFEGLSENINMISYGDTVENKTPLYKIIKGDQWKIVVPLTESDVNKIGKKNSATVKLLEKNIKAKASIDIRKINGKYYGILTLNKYLINYVSQRYIDVEIIYESVAGLEIPKTAITEKDFYKIPKGYLTESGSNSGFNKVIYEDGKETIQFASVELYWSDDEFYYVSTKSFDKGTNLLIPEGTDKYTISATASLTGVMNINKGFAVFKIIQKKCESNHNYIIITPGMNYGVSVYDHIALYGDSIQENEFIY